MTLKVYKFVSFYELRRKCYSHQLRKPTRRLKLKLNLFIIYYAYTIFIFNFGRLFFVVSRLSSKLYAYKYGSAIELIATLRLRFCFRFRFGRSIMDFLGPEVY